MRAATGRPATDLGFTRDRHLIVPKSAIADLGRFETRRSAKSAAMLLSVRPKDSADEVIE
jgi:hypothetical protein